MSSDNHGKIYEYVDTAIVFTIENTDPSEGDFTLRVSPSTVTGTLNVKMDKDRVYSGTFAQVKQHIMDAIEIASLSTYAENSILNISIPLYPRIRVPVTDVEKVRKVLDNALNNYV